MRQECNFRGATRLLRVNKFLCAILLLCSVAGRAGTPPRYANTIRPVPGSPTLSFVSDTQSPLWFEKFWITADENETATRRILFTISKDPTCAALFHLGDITALGSFVPYWEDFEWKSKELRDSSIPVFPAFGNHDYLPLANRARENLIKRFPWMRQSWYETRAAGVAVLLLNSNFNHLSDSEKVLQQKWYEERLEELDGDPSVNCVVVGCHHAPFTNSKIVAPSEDVQRRFVPRFIKSRKAKLFITGHSHAFEHFLIQGKDFLVIGGGGGLLHPLYLGDNVRWHDEFPWDDSRRFFHYVRITPEPHALCVQVLRLLSDYKKFETCCVLEISED